MLISHFCTQLDYYCVINPQLTVSPIEIISIEPEEDSFHYRIFFYTQYLAIDFVSLTQLNRMQMVLGRNRH